MLLVIFFIILIWLLYTEKIRLSLLATSIVILLMANVGYIYEFLKMLYPQIINIFYYGFFSLFVGLLFILYCFVQLFPTKADKDVPFRVKIIYAGNTLFNAFWMNVIVQIILFIVFPNQFKIISFNIIVWLCFVGFTFLNAYWRIFIFSQRLRLARRLILLIFIWIPIIPIIYMQRIARAEYDFACNKVDLENIRKDGDICETKYPLLLLHGIGFRDLKYFNYWGRIPKNLKKNGATIYYGHQEAFGTIEANGVIIKSKILEILEKENCEKVNIIAHSKGGLDARYTISTLGMSEQVASLTTISTPHHGSYLADFAIKYAPNSLYQLVAKLFNNWFAKIGDQNPDFYTSTQQLTSSYAKTFNEANLNDEQIYYQSYASVMKNMFSHGILSVPYLLMLTKYKNTDGLVQVESAKWGIFKTVFSNNRVRGISHGDMIDLTREDYKNFNVVETYIDIVKELKQNGY